MLEITNREKVNQLLSEAVIKLDEACEIAANSNKLLAVVHTDILRHMSIIQCHLKEIISENQ